MIIFIIVGTIFGLVLKSDLFKTNNNHSSDSKQINITKEGLTLPEDDKKENKSNDKETTTSNNKASTTTNSSTTNKQKSNNKSSNTTKENSNSSNKKTPEIEEEKSNNKSSNSTKENSDSSNTKTYVIGEEDSSNIISNTNADSEPEQIIASIEYICPFGYTLSNNQCIKESVTVAERRYYCSSGKLEGSFCVANVQTSVNISFSAKASCSNYANTGLYDKCTCEKSGGEWLINGCYTIKTKKTVADMEYFCNYDETLSGSLCVKIEYTIPTINYVCPAGYIASGSLCYKY